MSDNIEITEAAVWQGGDAVLMKRVRNLDGTYLQQADVASIALTVYDRANAMAVVVGPLALTVASVIFNTLQPYDGVLWRIDRTGYNFKYRIAGAAAFPNVSDYRVDAIIILTDNTKMPLQWDLSSVPVP